MYLKRIMYFFLALLWIPGFVYAQILDNRDLPPESLRQKPPFVPTDRAAARNKDTSAFFVLDNADDIVIQDQTETDVFEITMTGNVRVRFDNNYIKAEKMIITVKDSIVINIGAYGNVEFTFGESKYLAESINYQPDMERGVMYDVRSTMGASFGTTPDMPWFYTAERVTIQGPDRFVLENITLSTSDSRFDHYSVFATKLWYLQGKIALAAGIQYKVGQASFVWLPMFFQLEGGSGIHTSFGSEKRIGYYFINNYVLDSKIGKFWFGFDIYERQGQYFKLEYTAPSYGILKSLKFNLDLANDVRIVKNGDLYSQWIYPQFNPTGELERMTQFGWHYKIDLSLATNDINVNINFEDLNDPFFMSKYSYRSRFDNSKSINFFELLNPTQNSWFGYQGDAQPQVASLTRGFTVNTGRLAIKGNWELIRITRPNNSNQFLNSYYAYKVRNLTLPEISYDFGTLNLVDYKYSTKAQATVVDSTGKSRKMLLSQIPRLEKILAGRSNRVITRTFVTQADNTTKLVSRTNWEKITITNIITNDYEWLNIKTTANVSASYTAQQTFGTNSSSTVTDFNTLTNTNWTSLADLYRHEEKGMLNYSMGMFNNAWTFKNGLNFNYTEQWSSYGESYTNSQRISGFKLDYQIGTTFQPKLLWNDTELDRVSVPLDISVDFTYPAYYVLRMQDNYLKESSLNWKNSIALEAFQWRRIPILGLKLGADWTLRYRVPTEEQQTKFDNDPSDIYINNKIYDRITARGTASILWFNIGTETTIDILRTETNRTGSIFGNDPSKRFVGGDPKLLVQFQPDSKYHYIPKLIYRYSLLTNYSFNLEVVWEAKLKNWQVPALYPFIYEIEEFGFVTRYYQDFVNLRNSYLSLDFVMSMKFTRYLTFKFSSKMLNNKIYLYYGGIYNGESVLAPGETPKDFWQDLGDSLKIWDQAALKRASFKLQTLNFELIHDLQTWDMRLIFKLGRRIDDVKQIAFWEPYIGVAFTMKGANAANIFPEFQKRFIPAEYQ